MVAFGRLLQRLDQLERFAQLGDGFGIRRSLLRAFARLLPECDCLLIEASLSEVVSEQFRTIFSSLGKLLLQDFGDAAVKRLPFLLQQRFVGRVLNQGVLERPCGSWRTPSTGHDLGPDQLVEFFRQFGFLAFPHRRDQLPTEITSQYGRKLDDFAITAHPIESRDEQVLQRGRYSGQRERSGC